MQHMVEDALGSNFDFQSMGSEANGDEVSEDEGNDNEDEVNGEKGKTAKQMRWHHLNIYWVDERAKKTYESFQEKVENLSQVGEASGSGTKEVDAATRLKLWAESAGAAQMKAVEQRTSDAEHRANAAEQRATVAQEESQRANKRTKNLERQVKKLAENISCIKGDQHRRHRDYEEDDSDSMDDSIDSLDD
ncbi:hypothetical protein P8452_43493 [Trifolium repens]|nr:hypothetical protein P8452_43493 [Trifolium repens]